MAMPDLVLRIGQCPVDDGGEPIGDGAPGFLQAGVVAPALMARCQLTVRIPQPGGEESLNVAAATAICLYESARQAL